MSSGEALVTLTYLLNGVTVMLGYSIYMSWRKYREHRDILIRNIIMSIITIIITVIVTVLGYFLWKPLYFGDIFFKSNIWFLIVGAILQITPIALIFIGGVILEDWIRPDIENIDGSFKSIASNYLKVIVIAIIFAPLVVSLLYVIDVTIINTYQKLKIIADSF